MLNVRDDIKKHLQGKLMGEEDKITVRTNLVTNKMYYTVENNQSFYSSPFINDKIKVYHSAQCTGLSIPDILKNIPQQTQCTTQAGHPKYKIV